MEYPERLADYPWIIVRVGCIYCRRSGSYKLARLASRFGADISMEVLRRQLAADCAYIDRTPRKYTATCGCHFPDLERSPPVPPDLPPYIGGLRVVGGNPNVPKRDRLDIRPLSGHPEDDEPDEKKGRS